MAEEKVLGEERLLNHLPRHGKAFFIRRRIKSGFGKGKYYTTETSLYSPPLKVNYQSTELIPSDQSCARDSNALVFISPTCEEHVT